MMRNQIALVCLFLVLLSNTANAQLRRHFYNTTCPNVEAIVRAAVQAKFRQTFVTAPATLRLFFHDCLVRGCDASILLSSPTNQAEKDHPDNLSLAGDGFDTVVRAKAALDRHPQCRNRVSCADILALATRDVVNLVGGPNYPVELGRRDGKISTIASVQRRIPGPGSNLDQLLSVFAGLGLNITDLVALSGAHTLGFSHCSRFSNRIYPVTRTDPTLNLRYADQLRQMCPINVDPRIAIDMDPATPSTFDNIYFRNLMVGRGLFSSDQVLYTDSRSRPIVTHFAISNGAFGRAFARAMTKLGRVGVLTGNHGEIRMDCTRPN